MTETVKRIIELMEWRGDNAHSLEINTKLPISSISGWKKGKFNPSTEAITKLAKYFNVSADYLLCLTDEPTALEQLDLAERPTYTLSPELAELSKEKRFVNTAKVYKELPNEYRQEIYAYIMGVAVGIGLNVQKILGR